MHDGRPADALGRVANGELPDADESPTTPGGWPNQDTVSVRNVSRLWPQSGREWTTGYEPTGPCGEVPQDGGFPERRRNRSSSIRQATPASPVGTPTIEETSVSNRPFK